MDLEEFRNKPPWEHYEALLLNKGFVPTWDPCRALCVSKAPRSAPEPELNDCR
jgi:hypothetical protein